MNATLWHHLFPMPSVRSVIRRIVDGLATQISQLLLLPETADECAIVEAVRAEVLARGSCVCAMDLCQCHGEASCAALTRLLRQSLHAPADATTAEEILGRPGLADLVFVTGASRLSAGSQDVLISLLEQWSRISQNALQRNQPCPAAFCAACVNDGVAARVHSEVHLNVEWWWGVPSALELSLACRQAQGGYRQTADAVWRENVAPSLCTGDVNFIAAVWGELVSSSSELWRETRNYGEQAGWARAEIEDLVHRASFPLADDHTPEADANSFCAPPPAVRSLWKRGMVQFTPEFGCELHCAASAIRGEVSALERRLWRAQAGLLLPRLDAVRHQICGLLADRHGPAWPVQWETPQSAEELDELQRTHFSCQWGYLDRLLRRCPVFRNERRWLPLVTSCRDVRNELAHFRPIEFARFREIWAPLIRSVSAT